LALLLVVVARVPAEGVAEFEAYEGRVLPLLAEHGGSLERRLRSADGTAEVHVISFSSAGAFAAYVADARRAEHAPLLARSGASVEVLEVQEVAGGW
jgi:Fe-S cluster biogenesis protein NfuA